MTPVQRNALDFIAGYIERNRFSPTQEEIAAALGLASKSNAHRVVSKLIEQGLLVSDGAHKARRLRLPRSKCPHCGGELAP